MKKIIAIALFILVSCSTLTRNNDSNINWWFCNTRDDVCIDTDLDSTMRPSNLEETWSFLGGGCRRTVFSNVGMMLECYGGGRKAYFHYAYTEELCLAFLNNVKNNKVNK